MSMKCIVDCDPGIDDSFALAYLSTFDHIDVIGMTSIFGNSKIDNTTKNLEFLNEQLGFNAVIGKGSPHPLLGKYPGQNPFHGVDGFGETNLVADSYLKDDYEYAWDMLYRLCKENPQEITIMALGPITNLALAIKKYPDFAGLVKAVYIMGGSTVVGNELPHSEANFYNDPLAVRILLRSEIPCYITGLNATTQTELTLDEYDTFANRLSEKYPFINTIATYYKNINVKYGYDGITIHDLAAVYAMVHSDKVTFETLPVDICTAQGLQYGRLIVDRRPFTKDTNRQHVAAVLDKAHYVDSVLKGN